MVRFTTVTLACMGVLGSVMETMAAPVASDPLPGIRQLYLQAQANSTSVSSVAKWVSSLGSNGQWSDIDYTSGCDGRRASWPAIGHWSRLQSMAYSFYSNNDANMLSKIQLAMDYWFSNDYTSDDCIANGGLSNATCPCGTPGFWNTNWYDQVIGIPKLSSVACVFVQANLTDAESAGCQRLMSRSWSQIDQFLNGLGYITGANTLDVSSVGLGLALFTNNQTIMGDVFQHVNGQIETLVDPNDGIKVDGSFFQHDGVLYNGNYGAVLQNDYLLFAAYSANTTFDSTADEKSIFAASLEGTEWMTMYDAVSKIVRWEYSCLGRMVSMSSYSRFGVNIGQYSNATSTWLQYPALSASAKRLQTTGSTANPGQLNGNRMFWEADYMIMRRDNYVVSLKMFSSRIRNTECVNAQNILGYHLSDGLLYTYMTGNEYVDIFPTWDWYLLPGTTVAYNANDLNCNNASSFGVETFVGGVTDGTIGVGAMQYMDPQSVSGNSTNWNKGYFFFNNQYVVVGNDISTKTGKPMYSTLDQRKLESEVHISNSRTPVPTNTTTNYTNPAWLWQGNLGYVFLNKSVSSLSVSPSQQSGNWSRIAIDTTVVTTNVFKSWITHKTPNDAYAYVVDVDVPFSRFQSNADDLARSFLLLANDKSASSVLSVGDNAWGTIFWQAGTVSTNSVSKSQRHGQGSVDDFSITVNHPSIVMLTFSKKSIDISLSDPTQLLTSLTVTLNNVKVGCAKTAASGVSCSGTKLGGVTLTVKLPTGEYAGSTVTGTLAYKG
ncbi:galactose mutarotase-like domain-containing protein [Gongronella butleri]|nr:galactose mutarotase-like domain-containing protein [Gongronella butleri]